MLKKILFFGYLVAFFAGIEVFGQVQIGNNIHGEKPNQFLGQSIALSGDGSRMAVGASGESIADTLTGSIQILEWVSNEWIQTGSTIHGDAYDRFGHSISFSGDGNIIAVSGPYASNGNPYTVGKVQVYSYNGMDWEQLGSDLSGVQSNGYFGWSIALSDDGSRLVVGAKGVGTGGQSYVYEFDGDDWFQLGDLFSDPYGELGNSVSISDEGNRIALGNWYTDKLEVADTVFKAGKVEVFEFSDGAWVSLGQKLYGEYSSEKIGWVVSLSGNGDRLVVSAPYNAGPPNGDLPTNSGVVRVYELIDSLWVQSGSDFEGAAGNSYLGDALSLSGNGNVLAFSSSGTVHLHKYEGSSWNIKGAGIEGIDLRPNILALSDNGEVLAIGSWINSETETYAGKAQFYHTGINWELNVTSLKAGGNEDSFHLTVDTPKIEFGFDHSHNVEQQRFQVQVSSFEDFSQIDKWDPGEIIGQDSSIIYNGETLEDGETCYVRVRGFSYGYYTDWRQNSFRMNSLPTNPILISSLDGLVNSKPIVIEVLNGTDAEGDDLAYYFDLFGDSEFVTKIDSMIILQSELADSTIWEVDIELEDNKNYYWTLSTFDGYEWSDSTLTGSFLLDLNKENPSAFELLSPGNQGNITALPIEFYWQSSTDNDPMDFVHYNLLISADSAFTDILQSFMELSDTSYSLNADFQFNEKYYWIVEAVDRDSLITTSEVFSFIFRVESNHIESEANPLTYSLSQNYPNPFNPTTYIRFSIPETSEVQLEVFNMLGQKVAGLVNESKTAGWHTVTFDASQFSSGFYIYRVKANNFVSTKKLMLIK
ncbi:MAG: T9SS type A sorting domain-containing protein [Balneolales bacterium]